MSQPNDTELQAMLAEMSNTTTPSPEDMLKEMAGAGLTNQPIVPEAPETPVPPVEMTSTPEQVSGIVAAEQDLDQRETQRIEKALAVENERRGKFLSHVDVPNTENPVDAWAQGAIGTALGALEGRSHPAIAMDEMQALRTKEGDRSPSVEAALGSVINIGSSGSLSEAYNKAKKVYATAKKGNYKDAAFGALSFLLNPAASMINVEKLDYALKNATIYSPEDAKTFIKKMYNTPVIDENGRVNIESLYHSAIPKDIQTEILTNYAAYRTGIQSKPFWRNVVTSRLGRSMRDNAVEGTAKYLLQFPDAALFNIPSAAFSKMVNGTPEAAVLMKKYGKVQEGISPLYPIAPNTDAEQHGGDWYVTAKDGSKVKVPDYLPEEGVHSVENRKRITEAIFADTMGIMEAHAFEALPQIADPTLLFSGGGSALLKGAKALSKIERVAKIVEASGMPKLLQNPYVRGLGKGLNVSREFASPYTEVGGLTTKAAQIGMRVPGMSSVGRAILDIANTESNAGRAFRALDRVGTSILVNSAAARYGAPRGMEDQAGIVAGLMTLGMSPFQMKGVWHTPETVMRQENKKYHSEIMAQENPYLLSNYTKSKVKNALEKTGLTYEQYRGMLLGIDGYFNYVREYRDNLDASKMTPGIAEEVVNTMKADPAFQQYADELYPLFKLRNANVFGSWVTEKIEQSVKEASDFLTKSLADSPQPHALGTASNLPHHVKQGHMLDSLKAQLQDGLSPALINDRKAVTQWLDAEIAGQHIEGAPHLSPDLAAGIKGQIFSRQFDDLYKPIAIATLVSHVAAEEGASSLQKFIGTSEVMSKNEHLSNALLAATDEDIQKILGSLPQADAAIAGEGPIGRLRRLSAEKKGDNVSPDKAAVELEKDMLATLKKIEPMQTLIEKMETEIKGMDPKTTQYLAHREILDSLYSQVSAIKRGSQLGEILRMAQDRTKEYVDVRGKIHREALEATGIPDAIKYADPELTEFGGAKREHELLQEKSRLDAIGELEKLEGKRDDTKKSLGRLMERKISLREEIVKKLEAAGLSKHLPAVESRLAGKNVKLPAKVKDVLEKELTLASNIRSAQNEMKRKLGVQNEMIDTFGERIDGRSSEVSSMGIADAASHQVDTVAKQWFNRALGGSALIGLDETPFYKNLRMKITDELVRVDDIRKAMIGKTGWEERKLPTAFNPDLIAYVRMMGDKDFVKNLVDEAVINRYPGAMENIRKQTTALADQLALIAKDSNLAASGLEVVQNAIKGDPTTFLDLVKAYKNLRDNFHISKLLSEEKSLLPQVEAMIVEKSNGVLSYDEWKTLYKLTTDSAAGKAARKTLQDEGIYRPWMKTYQHEIYDIIDKAIRTPKDIINKAIADVEKLVDVEPGSLDATMIAAKFLKFEEDGNLPQNSMAKLMGYAAAWKERTSVDMPGMQTGEQIATGIDRMHGIDVGKAFNETLDAANIADHERALLGRELHTTLNAINDSGIKYKTSKKPHSKIRKFILKNIVAVDGHAAHPTEMIEFVHSGYHQGITEYNPSVEKSGLTPIEGENRQTTALLPDHLIVNGQETALGKLYSRWIESDITTPEEFLREPKISGVAKRVGADEGNVEWAKLNQFLAERLKFYGKMSPAEYRIAKQAITALQDANREALQRANKINGVRNTKDGTAFVGTGYEPWRLEHNVQTRSSKVAYDPLMLGGWQEADKMMGGKYSTSPENQIAKAQRSGLSVEDILDAPEDIVLGNFAKSVNDIESRQARSFLSRNATLLELQGSQDAAEAIRDALIAPNRGIEQPIWRNLSRIEQNETIGPVWAPLAAIGRQFQNPFLMLISPWKIIFEQGLQQGLLQSGNQGARNYPRAAQTVARVWWEGVKDLKRSFGGSMDAFWHGSERLDADTAGKSIQFSGAMAGTNERIYGNFIRRTDPWVEAQTRDLYRNAMNPVKDIIQTERGLEGLSNFVMWRFKEIGENRAAMTLLPQAGAIWSKGMEKVDVAMKAAEKMDGATEASIQAAGAREMYRYLGDYLTGPTATEGRRIALAKAASSEGGLAVNAYESFASQYVKMNIGIWSHMNRPRLVRKMGNMIPGAAQFYDAMTLGMHRAAMGVVNTKNLPAEQRAGSIIGALSIIGMSAGLVALSQETGIDEFKRLALVRSVDTLWKAATEGKGIPSKMQISPSVEVSGRMQQIAAAIALGKEYLQIDGIRGMDPQKQEEAKQKSLDKLVDSFLRQTPLVGVSDTFGKTPSGFYQISKELALGAILGGDIADPVLIQSAMNQGYDLVRRRKQIEGEVGQPLSPEDNIFLNILRLASDYNQKIEETLWRQDYPETAFGLRVGASDLQETQRYARSILNRDIAAKELMDRITEKIKEYDEAQRLRKELWTGSSAKRPSETILETNPR